LIKEVKVRKCVITPNTDTIAEECAAVIMTHANTDHRATQWHEPMLATAKQMLKYCKTPEFMLNLIATLDPRHRFFDIDYLPMGKFV